MNIKGIVEALLFSAGRPVSRQELQEIIEAAPSKIEAALLRLQEEYKKQDRSLQIVEIAGGFQMSTRKNFSPWLRKFHRALQKQKLSRAALETLAIVAYKQPVVRADIEAIRGVNVDWVMKLLLERRLIKITGKRKCPGRPLIYRTTEDFLRRFGLSSLSELPDVNENK